MKARSLPGDRWLVRLDLGEEILATLTAFLGERRLRCAALQGIGAAREIELGYLDVARKSYERRRFPEDMEIVSLAGNVSVKEGKPFVHAHCVASDREFRTVGGHFFSGVVSATTEVVVAAFPGVEVARRARRELGFFDLDV